MSNSLYPFNLSPKPLLIILSGPSGVGKDAVLNRMRELKLPLQFITTVTTRSQRPGEIDNVHYHFVSADEFQSMIARNEFLEWARVYDNWYGVPGKPVKEALDSRKDTIVKVDVQGAATIKKILPQAVFIFLTAPSVEELNMRLKQRDTESPPDLALRLKTAESELRQLPVFDYLVFNRYGEIERAVSDIRSIITAEKCRVTPRKIQL